MVGTLVDTADSKRDVHAQVADAIDRAIRSHQAGSYFDIGEGLRELEGELYRAAAYDDSLSFALSFWDDWADAANHGWQYHEPLGEAQFLTAANSVAAAVRLRQVPDVSALSGYELPGRRLLEPRLSWREWLTAWLKR